MKEQENQQDSQLQAVNYQQEGNASQQQVQRKPNKTGIPDRLKAVVEHFSGLSLDEVRVHYNSDKPTEIGAFAYAEYPNIYIAPGEEKHLAEEVWHIVQQMKGEVPKTTQVNDKAINDQPKLEKEAKTKGKEASKDSIKNSTSQPLEKPTSPSTGVSQRATADASSKTEEYYGEYNIPSHSNKRRKTSKAPTPKIGLKKISKRDYNRSTAIDPVTEETGYTVYDIPSTENHTDWQINDKVVQKYADSSGNYHIKKSGSFKLPVSCIESAEHIVHYAHAGGNIPDWDKSQSRRKSVDLALSKTRTGNQDALNISTDTITKTRLRGYKDYDFSAGALNVGDGLLVVKANDPASSVHAVAVVAKNSSTGQFIVLERNAGMTSGDYDYVDSDWTLNIYDSPAAFKASMPNSNQYLIGRLKA